MKYDVCAIGLGYVGLPTAALLATQGRKVLGVDIRQDVLDKIRNRDLDDLEPGLGTLVRAAIVGENLSVSLQPASADTFVIAVPTPVTNGNEPDLDAVFSATRAITPHVAPDSLVLIESTIPVGTTEAVADAILSARPDLRSASDGPEFAHCPERVLPGQILKELIENDRIVGGLTEGATRRAVSFYKGFVEGAVLGTTARTAELAKLAENAFRDVNIAFANELSILCKQFGIDVWELIELANRHPRVSILRPGPGVGGHCVAVDPWFIVAAAPDKARLIRAAREVNDSKPHHVADEVEALAKARGLRGPIGCLGLAFKANVDDVRESPAAEVIKELCARNLPVLACDPHVHAAPSDLVDLNGFSFADTQTVLKTADILVVLTDHKAFQEFDLSARDPASIVDTRGLFRK